MAELQQLQQLLVIARTGTLSAAALELHISQPALTRSMQRLEEQFGLPLFDRKKNKITLNEAGQLAVERAKIVLEAVQDMDQRMADYARSLHTLHIGSCAPGPLWLISPQLSAAQPNMTLSSEMKEPDHLLDGLKQGVYQLVILDGPVEDAALLSKLYFREQLFVSVPPAHPLALRKNLPLSDLAGQTMLLFSDLGIWQTLLDEKAQGIHFIVQTERQAFTDLISASFLPSFTTNLTTQLSSRQPDAPLERIAIPISDQEATKDFYVCALKKNRRLLDSVHGWSDQT